MGLNKELNTLKQEVEEGKWQKLRYVYSFFNRSILINYLLGSITSIIKENRVVFWLFLITKQTFILILSFLKKPFPVFILVPSPPFQLLSQLFRSFDPVR